MRDIVIVDYGMGNLGSVAHAFQRLGVDCGVASSADGLANARAIILPGVGAFRAAMKNLRERGFHEALTDQVLHRRIPFLGICLGLQLIARDSTEHGLSDGLGWLDGHVVRMEPEEAVPIPHVGWNEVTLEAGSPLFERLPAGAHFYFDHGYHLQCSKRSVSATCRYGGEWVAAVQKDNIHAVQFHPEKSQRNGLRVLRNFLRLVDEQPAC